MEIIGNVMANKVNIRVRYQETDQMGVVYHSNYLIWFEVGRAEMIRDLGLTYAEMEKMGVMMPVTFANVQYKAPAHYDDKITIITEVMKLSPVRIEFAYQVLRDDDLLAEGGTGHAFVNLEGKPIRLDKVSPPAWEIIKQVR